jgi:hypothetical protein
MNFLGPLLGFTTSFVSGIAQKREGLKMIDQAKSLRSQGAQMQARPIQKEYWQKYFADKYASMQNMPGFEQYIDQLSSNNALAMRNISQTSPSGSASLEAITNTIGQQNAEMQKYNALNAQYRSDLEKTSREDLDVIGKQKDYQVFLRDEERKRLMQAAAELEKAGTYNKMQGLNKQLSSVSQLGNIGGGMNFGSMFGGSGGGTGGGMASGGTGGGPTGIGNTFGTGSTFSFKK